MKWISIGFLIASWIMWLLARFGGMGDLSGWAFVVSYFGVAIGLLIPSGVGGALGNLLRIFGIGFIFLAIGEIGWLTLFGDGGTGYSVILPNIPYYLADILIAYAVLRMFLAGRPLFDFPNAYLWGSALASIITVFILSIGHT